MISFITRVVLYPLNSLIYFFLGFCLELQFLIKFKNSGYRRLSTAALNDCFYFSALATGVTQQFYVTIIPQNSDVASISEHG